MSTSQQQILQKRRDLKEMYKMKTSISNGTICTDRAVPYMSSISEEMATATTDFSEIPDDCSVIMNGHYSNTHAADDDYFAGEESKPFLEKSAKKKSTRSNVASGVQVVTYEPKSNKEKMSGAINLASTDESSDEGDPGDDGGEVMQDTRLLKCTSAHEPLIDNSPKFKLGSFKPSPKKSSSESRSHIQQHRPLGFQPSPAYSLQDNSKCKRKWVAVKCLATMMVAFVVCLLFSLAVIVILSSSDRCEAGHRWWEDVVVYEIFPASFQDTDNDGFGDFKGILSRADYIRDNLSIDVIRLNSIFSALDYPLEYEHVIDFTNVDPHLGRMKDFNELVAAIHSKGMYLVLDLNPTVTSDQHSWAAHWLLHRTDTYNDFYVNFTDNDVKIEPPMESVNLLHHHHQGGKLRERANPHRTFGTHIYLNWSNAFVQDEMLDVLRFWLSVGVDGFYMKHLEEMKLESEVDMSLILSGWRNVLDEFSVNSSKKILAGSASTMQKLMDRYGQSLDSALFDVVDAGIDFSIGDIGAVSQEVAKTRNWVRDFSSPPSMWWHFGSVETTRLASRIGENFTLNGMFVLSLLPGTVSIFYGDEIGLKDTYEIASRKVYKGGQLTLMQWSASANGNFTHDNAKPWLPVQPDFSTADFGLRINGINHLGRLFYLKKSSLQKADAERTPFGALVSNIDRRSKNSDQVSYSWSRDPSTDLLIVDLNEKERRIAVLASNFGKSPVRLNSVLYLRQTGFLSSIRETRLVFSTDSSFPPFDASKGLLHPGHSVLCLYDR